MKSQRGGRSSVFTSMLVLAFVFNIIPIAVLAQDKDFSEMSLDELLTVSIASKKLEEIVGAPAIVSVITSEDIINRGYQSIYDALGSIPGASTVETYWGINQVFLRGIYSDLHNDKILLLINGHPFMESINSSFYIDTFPIEAVERVEVVRGPGSTLYGTNAFSGVINIVTFDGSQMAGGNSWHMRLGEHHGYGTGLALGGTSGGSAWMVAAEVKDDNGYEATIPVDELGNRNVKFNSINNYKSVFALLQHKGFSLDLFAFDQNKSKIDAIPAVWGTLEQTRNEWDGFFLGLKYDSSLTERTSLMARTSYNNFERLFPSRLSGGYVRFDSAGSRFDAEVTLDSKLNERVRLMAGAVYEYLVGDHYDVVDANTGQVTLQGIGDRKTDSKIAAYGHVDATISQRVTLTGGSRFEYNDDYGSFINPRAALVFKVNNRFSVKALYGSAYRAPNIFEKNAGFSTTTGNPDLEPERLRTVDLGIDYTTGMTSLRLNAYHTKAKDLIKREIVDPVTNRAQFFNFDETSVTGFEGEVRNRGRNREYYLNLSYSSAEDMAGDRIEYIPRVIINAGACFHSDRLRGSVNLHYVDETTNTISGSDNEVSIDGSTSVDLKLGYRITQQLTLSVFVRNALDEDFMAPEFVRRRIGMLPNGPGRTFVLELRKGF